MIYNIPYKNYIKDTPLSNEVQSNFESVEKQLNTGPLYLTDGVTAPATVSGVAQIYVDAADGDLKVKFGDGFVRVLAADS